MKRNFKTDDGEMSGPRCKKPLRISFATNKPFGCYNSGAPIGIGKSSAVCKKVVIKNLEHVKDKENHNGVAEGKANENIVVLNAAITAMQRNEPTSTTLGHLCNIVQSECHQARGGELYALVLAHIEEFASHISRMLEEKLDINDSKGAFLLEMNKWWIQYTRQLELLRTIFTYLDQYYILSQKDLTSIWNMGLAKFETILSRRRLMQSLTYAIISAVLAERKGKETDRILIKSLLQMLSTVGMYERFFELVFLKSTEEFYCAEGRAKVCDLDTAAYLQHVENRLKEEAERATSYLQSETRKPLIRCVEQALIAEQVEAIVEGMGEMVNSYDLANLSLMFRLLSRTKNGLTSLKHHFTSHVKSIGAGLVCDNARESTLVADVTILKHNLDTIIKQCFENSNEFKQSEMDAFAYFINTKQTKLAQLIAKFMDVRLRAGNKAYKEKELDRVIVIFRFLDGKDVFEAFYRADLSKRLLCGRSASYEAEKSILAKLKQECGPEFTTKLEGMFKDMELSKDFLKRYKQRVRKSDAGNALQCEFNACVLTMGFWPTYQAEEVPIPQELYDHQEQFKQFYLTKHKGRKLQWQYSLMTAVVKGRFNKGAKELDLSFFQTLVLLAFNKAEEKSFAELKEHTKIETKELKRTLQSLACGKYRVIQKLPRGQEIAETDRFVFNEDFADPKHRIHLIMQVVVNETNEQLQKTEGQVFQDRRCQIDAAIVRIAKARKSILHVNLMAELYEQLRFPASSTDLKKRIETLIDREYLRRDKSDNDKYHYMT